MSDSGIRPHPMVERPWFEQDELDFQEFSAGGVRTFAVLEGRADGQPIVFLHDVPGASFVWRPLLKAFPRTCRLIAFDLPGWGRSRVRGATGSELSAEYYTRWLSAALQAQAVERCDFVAHGLGVNLALSFLQDYPERVERIVAMDYALGSEHSDSIVARVAALFQRRSWTRADIELLTFGLDAEARAEFERLLLEQAAVTDKRETAKLRGLLANRARDVVERWPRRGTSLMMIQRSGDSPLKDVAVRKLDGGRWPMLSQPKDLRTILTEYLYDVFGP